MYSQLSRLVLHLTSVAAVSNMHSVYALPSILLRALSTRDKVDHIFGLTGQVMPDPVAQASVVALEPDTFS